MGTEDNRKTWGNIKWWSRSVWIVSGKVKTNVPVHKGQEWKNYENYNHKL